MSEANPYEDVGNLKDVNVRAPLVPDGTTAMVQFTGVDYKTTPSGTPLIELNSEITQGPFTGAKLRNTLWMGTTISDKSREKAAAKGKEPVSAFSISRQTLKLIVLWQMAPATRHDLPAVDQFFQGCTNPAEIAQRLGTLLGKTGPVTVGVETSQPKEGKQPFVSNSIKSYTLTDATNALLDELRKEAQGQRQAA